MVDRGLSEYVTLTLMATRDMMRLHWTFPKYLHACARVCVCACVCVCVRACVSVCLCVCMHVYIHVFVCMCSVCFDVTVTVSFC